MDEKEYIEREAALKDYQTICNGVECARCPIRDKGHCKFEAYIRSIPAADVRPVVRGEWIDRDDDYYGWNMWACSACGEEFVLTEGTPDMNDYHFCPNCGADMREES